MCVCVCVCVCVCFDACVFCLEKFVRVCVKIHLMTSRCDTCLYQWSKYFSAASLECYALSTVSIYSLGANMLQIY